MRIIWGKVRARIDGDDEVAVHETTATLTNQQSPDYRPDQRSVFIVDDDCWQRLEIADHLRYKGFSVVEFETGSGALEEVARCKPRLVLMDIRMPGHDGIQATKAMMSSSPNTMVVLMTGVSKEIEHARASCDAFAVIGKPFLMNELSRYISAAFGEDRRASADSDYQHPRYEGHKTG